ncbi:MULTISPECIES: sensor histidine kinase [Actinomyces]|nr:MULTISPECIES: sensor histidine kinase [Actinomyces]
MSEAAPPRTTMPHGRTVEPGPDGQTVEPGPDGRPQAPFFNWRADTWLAFLVLPIVFVLHEPHPWQVRALGVCSILAFAAVYILTFAHDRTWHAIPEGATVAEELRLVRWPLAAMLVSTLVALPAVGWWWVSFVPYFCSYFLFLTRMRTGLLATALICAATLLVVGLVQPEQTYLWTAVGTCLSSGGIALARLSAESEERRADIARERAAAARERAAAQTRDEISRDIHDLLGHSLTVLTLKAEVARRLLDADPERVARELDEIIDLSRASLADVRSTVTRLRAPDLPSQVEATRTALGAAEVALTLIGSPEAVPEPQRPLLSWALREATTNVVRHARASRVEVEIARGLLRVSDDGVGLPPAAAGGAPTRAGNGLTGLRSRIEAEGGALTLTSPAPDAAPSHPGTILEVRLP